MSTLSTSELTVLRGGCPVVDHVALDIQQGEFVGLIGPNGAGKTTLMRAMLGLIPAQGTASLLEMSVKERAKRAAWMPQHREIAWPIAVDDLVALGRTAQGKADPHDPLVTAALDHMGLGSFRNRIATQLSGGEQARVLIARALAQDTPILMADEPIAGLDPANQLSTMQVFQDIAAAGKTIFTSLHDLGLAARYCSKLALMHQGTLVTYGTPQEVLTTERLQSVFNIRAHFKTGPEGPIFQPLDVLS